MRAFPHHFPELAREDESSGAWIPGRFDKQNVAAERRPGEPRGDPRQTSSQRHLILEDRRPEHGGKILGADRDCANFSFRDPNRGMAQRLADLAFEISNSRLPGVVSDDVAYRLVRNCDLAGEHPVCFHLAHD